MNFRSFEDLVKAVRRGMHKVPADIDGVAFIPRSGVFPGSMIALYRNVPFTNVESLLNRSFFASGTTRKVRSPEKGKLPKFLVVDDSVLTGGSFQGFSLQAPEAYDPVRRKQSEASARNQQAGKAVICTETMQFYRDAFLRRIKRQFRKWMRSATRQLRTSATRWRPR